jgi:hypothetical protein
LQRLLIPFGHRKWTRVLAAESGDAGRHGAPESGGALFAPPIHDENAPDLYIPLMAVITYVLLVGLLKGTRMRFTPEVRGRDELPCRRLIASFC